MTGWEAIYAALRDISSTDAGAAEVVSALYDVAWVALDSPAQTYTEACDEREAGASVFAVSWRGAGALAAEIRGRDEHYLTWAWDAQAGVVSERVGRAMAALGLRPVV